MGACITSSKWMMKNNLVRAHRFSRASVDDSGERKRMSVVGENSVQTCDQHSRVALLEATLADVFEDFGQSQYSQLFSAHPELLFSNRAAVMCTGMFVRDEVVGTYRVLKALPTGTIGRSFLVKSIEESGIVSSENSSSGYGEKGAEYVMKVVTFITYIDQVHNVMEDHKVLSNLNHENILCPVDILGDGEQENLLFVSPYVSGRRCDELAGNIKEEELLRMLRDIAVGLRVLHSHKIYHHNLKLDNIFIKDSGSVCIADAGFWRLFSVQSPDCLLFNGELTSIPPEVFLTAGLSDVDHAKVDIWGFGVLMYRLAFGCEVFEVGGKTLEEVETCVLYGDINFPSPCIYSDQLKEVIRSCLDRDPKKRPTIMQLLRHSLFRTTFVPEKNSLRDSIHTPNVLTTVEKAEISPSLSCSSTASAHSELHWCYGLRVGKPLGNGRRCDSFLVYQRRNPSKPFVVKVVNMSTLKIVLKDKQDVDDIHKALAFCCKVRHPNLLHLHFVVDGKDVVCATQPYVQCEFLNKKFPPVTNSEDASFTVRHMLVDVLKALHVLHKNRTPHLCLTPSNIFYQPGTGFVVADFGPVFLTRQDVLTGGESGRGCYSVPLWVLADIMEPMSCATHCIDIFCVGLLAASGVPSIFKEVWNKFIMHDGEKLVVQELIEKVNNEADIFSPVFVDFIVSALTVKKSALDLLKHPYLRDMVDISELLEIKPLDITVLDVHNALRNAIQFSEDAKLSRTKSESMKTETTEPGNDDADKSTTKNNDSLLTSCASSGNGVELNGKPPLSGAKFVCSRCQVRLERALFKCMVCPMYICCTKCLKDDKHAEGHTLAPYFIRRDEHGSTDHVGSDVLSPINIKNMRPLEELTVRNNLQCESPAKLPLQQAAFSYSSKPVTSETAFTTAKKKVLPKPADVDDWSWAEEIKNSREEGCPELLLYRFDLTSVPTEVFDPPLTHVVRVDLSYNKLTSIPHELSFLPLIRSLIVANNELKELPDSLGDLSQLEHLDLSHNQLQELPQTFVYLRQLSTIAMDYNDFADIPESLVDLATATKGTPVLSVVYMAENPRIIKLPSYQTLSNFGPLKLALDNEPSMYKAYMDNNLSEKLPHITMVWNKIYPDLIIENVFCGSFRSALSEKVYKKLSILNVLTVCRDLAAAEPVGGRKLTINIDDIEGVDIQKTFGVAVDFIDESLRRGEACLIHCFAGMSRSATTVIAYLMIKKGMRLDEAYCTTKRGRPCIYPNQGFFKQLCQLDAELFPNQRPLDIASMERDKIPTGQK